MSTNLEFIEFAVEQGALQFGEFTLKSGRVSPYFFNAGLFQDGHALAVLSKFYAQAIIQAKIEFDVLFGPAYKGIPLVATVAMNLATEYNKNVGYAFNRKEVKSYGDGGKLVGAPLQGRVLIVDDVITAGTAIREAVKIIKDHHAQAVGVVNAFDRQERGLQNNLSAVQQVEQEFKLQVIAIANAKELIGYAESKQLYSKYLGKLKAYLEQYQAKTI